MTTFRLSLLAASLAATFPVVSLAQQQPDAGQTLQQQQQAPQLPGISPRLDIQTPATSTVAPGGAMVTLRTVRFVDNTIFSEDALRAVLGDFAGQGYDLAGLRTLADQISRHYRENGYPFARAFVPVQEFAEGMLTIQIVEGRYGKVTATGDEKLAPQAQAFLGGLKMSEVIESASLERITLLLDDLPGIRTAPVIQPGEEPGTGDLIVKIAREPMLKGDIGFDNHGNRYTGEHRLRANLQFDSPFTLGDQITLRTLYTEEGMWLGSLGYSLPLGTSGLRGNIGYAHTYYELGEDFANLDAHGTAKVTSLGLSYPLIRSQKTNLTLAATYQHKKLNDRQGSTNTSNDKESDSWPISLQFDHRDGLGGGGVTYGLITYTAGRLKLDATLEAADRTSNTDTRGGFDKWTLDIARVQATPIANLILFGRVSTQWAGKNLDSSEGFSLGGANGVRAYPSGEGNGDKGWMIQLEIRYQMGAWGPYLFHDAGKIYVNADAGRITPAVTNNTRSLSGSGIGLRYNAGPWNADATLAWRNRGGRPTSDTADRNPRFWFTAGYRF